MRSSKSFSIESAALIGLLVLLPLLVFFPVIYHDFIILDDPDMIIDQPWIHDLNPDNLRMIFFQPYHYMYSPFALLFWALQTRVFGLDSGAFHLVTLCLHIICGFLTYMILRELLESKFISVIATAVYLVHPFQAQSLGWVSGQRTVLFGVLFSSAVLSYIRWIKAEHRKWYYASLVFQVVSSMVKGLAFTLPVVLFLVDFRFLRTGGRKMIIEKLPFILIAGLFMSVAWFSADPQMPDVSFHERFWTAFYGFIFYLSAFTVPVRMSCFYPVPSIFDFNGRLLFAAVSFAAACSAMVCNQRSRTNIMFGFGYFVVNIAPVIQLVRVGMPIAASDHFMYVPLLGLSLIFVECLRAVTANSGFVAKTAMSFAVLYVLFLGISAHYQCRIWSDSVSLFKHQIALEPEFQFARQQMGVAYLQRDDWKSAGDCFNSILNFESTHDADTWTGRATAYLGSGEYEKAYDDLTGIVEEFPDHAAAHFLLGTIHEHQGRASEAFRSYAVAVVSDGYFDAAWNRFVRLRQVTRKRAD